MALWGLKIYQYKDKTQHMTVFGGGVILLNNNDMIIIIIIIRMMMMIIMIIIFKEDGDENRNDNKNAIWLAKIINKHMKLLFAIYTIVM